MSKLAWTVHELTDAFDGWNAEVVFAETRGQARWHNLFVTECEADPLRLGVKRVRKFDQYAEAGKVPDRVLIEHGWFVICDPCGSHVNATSVEDEEAVFNDQGDAFCSQACYDKALKHQAS